MSSGRRNGAPASWLRPGVVVLVALAGAAGFLVGVVLDRPSPPRLTVAGPAVTAAGVDRTVRSREGAVAAGVRYATLLARLFPLDRDAAEAVVQDAASDEYRQVLVAAVDRQLVPLQRRAARLPGSTVYRQSVLATRVDAYVPERARVSVWVLATMEQTGQKVNPLASYTTFTIDLVWQRAAWRLDGTGQQAGPTPLTNGQPDLADDFAAALAGFTDWRPE